MYQLSVLNRPTHDYSITDETLRFYNPYATTNYKNSDEIIIPINDQNSIFSLHKSFLIIEGTFAGSETTQNPQPAPANLPEFILSRNYLAFLFKSLSISVNNVVVDEITNFGISISIKHHLCRSIGETNYGSSISFYDNSITTKNGKNFSFCVPLRFYSGLCEDYHKIFVNTSLQLKLVRSDNDVNLLCTDKATSLTLKLTKVQWAVPCLEVCIFIFL